MADNDEELTEQRGPSGARFREEELELNTPEELPPWMSPLPGMTQKLGPDRFQDVRNQDSMNWANYLPNIPSPTRQQQAILRVLDLRSNNPFQSEDRVFDIAAFKPPEERYTQMQRDIGLPDIARMESQFRMPDPSRDEYLRDIAQGDAPKGSIADDRKTNKQRLDEKFGPSAEQMANAEISKVPGGWQGEKTPTQLDIDILMNEPSNEMVDSFEAKFGKGSSKKYTMDEDEP